MRCTIASKVPRPFFSGRRASCTSPTPSRLIVTANPCFSKNRPSSSVSSVPFDVIENVARACFSSATRSACSVAARITARLMSGSPPRKEMLTRSPASTSRKSKSIAAMAVCRGMFFAGPPNAPCCA